MLQALEEKSGEPNFSSRENHEQFYELGSLSQKRGNKHILDIGNSVGKIKGMRQCCSHSIQEQLRDAAREQGRSQIWGVLVHTKESGQYSLVVKEKPLKGQELTKLVLLRVPSLRQAGRGQRQKVIIIVQVKGTKALTR